VTGVFDIVATEGFEQVAYCHDAGTGLRAIVAIHSTALGPSLGGTRFYPYADETDALVDVCRLAQGMTYKHAACGNDLGGGKAVILGDPATLRSEALFRAYGRFIEGLNGRYLTAEDVGTTQADMDLVRRETTHVTGVSESISSLCCACSVASSFSLNVSNSLRCTSSPAFSPSRSVMRRRSSST
jgi:valine dehydrogenase (NAD+)